MYETGRSRGCGGTGVWDGATLFVSRNWKTWKVLANGPVRSRVRVELRPVGRRRPDGGGNQAFHGRCRA